MLRTIGVALIAAALLATPALAVETQPAAASPIANPSKVATGNLKKSAKHRTVGSQVGKQAPAAKGASTSSAKAGSTITAASNARTATALPAKKKPKLSGPRKPGSAEPKTTVAQRGNSNQPKSHLVNSEKTKSSEAASQRVTKRKPADYTGSVAPRSVPTPGLY